MEPKFVDFKFEDEQRGDPPVFRLCYDFNYMVKAEEMTGCNLLRAISGGMTSKELRATLWAMLKTGHPDVALEEAGNLMTRDRELVVDKVGEVLFATDSVAQAASKKKAEADAAKRALQPIAPEAELANSTI